MTSNTPIQFRSDHLEYSNKPNPTHAIIWLHGLGDTGHGWYPVAKELNLNKAVRFILPHAPIRPITLNQGSKMPGWYDIVSLDFKNRADQEGIEQSVEYIHTLIDELINEGIPSHHIILAGFSQGGAIALQSGLRYPKKIGGILALSSYLPMHEIIPQKAHDANRTTAIGMTHGIFDTVIPPHVALLTHNHLATLGYPITWKTYQMAHEACSEQLNDIQAWLNLHLIN